MTAEGTDRPRPLVFISFASPDVATAEVLARELDFSGIPTFFAPRDIPGGMSFPVETVKAISACDIVVVLLSPSSIGSPHVRREVSLAIDERRALLPLAMPGTSYPTGFSTEWMYWLTAVQVMEYDGPAPTISRIWQMLPPPQSGVSRENHTVGVAPLRRSRRVIRKVGATRGSPSGLLRADREFISLQGREGELTRLEQWCLRDDDFDVRIMTGGAGQGKTRLGLELIKLMGAQDWDTRLVLGAAAGADEVLRLGDRRTLFVVDYAETRVHQLADLFDALLEHGVQEKVRVLLLARTASDWWKELLARSDAVAELLADVTVQPLIPLTEDRELVDRVYVAACEQFAAELNLPRPHVVAGPLRRFGSLLDILEVALAYVLTGSSEPTRGTDRLLAHERRYIAAAATADEIPDVDAVDLNRIAAGLTLLGAESEDAATSVIGECNRDLTPSVRRRIARLFRRLYPGNSLYIEGVRPDVLAEDLLADVLTDDGRLPIDTTGIGSPTRTPEQTRRAMTMLARGATRHQELGRLLDGLIRSGTENSLRIAIIVATQVEQPDLVTASIAAVIDQRPDLDGQSLMAAIPDETVALADLAAQLARTIIAKLPKPEAMKPGDVQLAMRCSNRFSDAGWPVEAADAAQLAVDRLLVDGTDDDSRRQLGCALTNLSNRLWEIGQIEESLPPALQAVDVLAATTCSVAQLAAARNNLAFRLCETAQYDAAVSEALQAEHLCRSPDGVHDLDLGKTLGSSLNNLDCIFLGMGHPHRAFHYGIACVDLRRSQATANRDRYLPFVARALANAAPAAEAIGDQDRADRLIIEARSLHELTGTRAPIFRFEQAESATIHARMLLHRGDCAQAKIVAQEAQMVLASIDMDLGALTTRVSTVIASISELADVGAPVPIGDVRAGLPLLLEYRDL